MRTVTSFLQTQLVINCCYAAIDEKEVFGNGNKVIDDDDDNKIKFNERGFDQQAHSAIENVEFNLQTRGPDRVTYGCLSRINENRELIPQLYLIDALGFRLINSSTIAVASKFKYVILFIVLINHSNQSIPKVLKIPGVNLSKSKIFISLKAVAV